MSFWNKNKLPAEYRDKTEDEIAELLAAGASSTTSAAAEKVRADSADAARIKAEKDAADSRAALEAAQRGGKQDDEPPVQRNAPTGPPTDAEWLTDPNAAFQRAIAPVTAVAMHSAIMAAKMAAEQFIQGQGPVERRLWIKFSKEIEAQVNAMPAESRILPQTWINQFTFIKGANLSAVVKEAQGSGDAFFSETATSTGGGLPNDDHKNDDTLTPEEEKVARRLGRTPAEYLAQKKKMKFGPAII